MTVFGLGPIGQMTARIAQHRGARAIGVDRRVVPQRPSLQWGRARLRCLPIAFAIRRSPSYAAISCSPSAPRRRRRCLERRDEELPLSAIDSAREGARRGRQG
jgi:hypothetical protein